MPRNNYLRAIILKIIAVILVFSPDTVTSQDTNNQKKSHFPPAEHFMVSPAMSKIKIDGRLNEPAWQKAALIKIPYEWFPGDNIPAPVKTECLVTFDKHYLYVAFRCYDPQPKKIRAHLMDRDSIDTFIQDDHIDFQIDTFNDERRGFQFRVNPLGVQADANFSELEGYEDFSWDAIWDSAGEITDFGYLVEIAVPFNQLRFPKKSGKQTWGFSAGRSYPRNVRHRMSSHVRDRNRNCLICQHNKISGFQGMSPGKNLEFDPTLTFNRTDNRQEFPTGKMANGDIKVEPGITARWGITPNLIFNATVNPDFSQVEADVAQLEVNTRFALRYPEKRPFFLEGADFFLTPMEAVFSRTIYNPLWGIKLTGKMGKNVLGFFSTQDRYNNLIFPSNQESGVTSREEKVFNNVLRYRRDIGKGSTLGLLYTGRTGSDYFNHVIGFDGFFRLSKKSTVNFQYLQSKTNYPEDIAEQFSQSEDTINGNALNIEYDFISRNLNITAGYQNLSENFRADSGFIPRVDYRRYWGIFQPIIWGKGGSWFDRFAFWIFAERIENQSGNLSDQSFQIGGDYIGPLQSNIRTAYLFNKEFYNGITYDIKRGELLTSIKPRGGLNISIYCQFGDSIDYTNSRLANSFLLNPLIEINLGKHLNLNFNHILERLSLAGDKIYIANLAQAKIIYNFNIRTFVRFIIQYTDINRNTDLYLSAVDQRTQGIFTQFLISYKINPQTVIFLGYSDNYLGLPGIDITQLNRTFFLKIGYALVQ